MSREARKKIRGLGLPARAAAVAAAMVERLVLAVIARLGLVAAWQGLAAVVKKLLSVVREKKKINKK